MKLSEMTVSDALGGKWGIRALLVAIVIGTTVVIEYEDKHTPIDHSLVAKNRKELAQCIDINLCVDGFLRMRNARAHNNLRIVASNSDSIHTVTVAKLVTLMARNDEDADRFFNKIDSAIFKNDPRFKETYFNYWMDQGGSY